MAGIRVAGYHRGRAQTLRPKKAKPIPVGFSRAVVPVIEGTPPVKPVRARGLGEEGRERRRSLPARQVKA